jgi:hypothetical protein
VRSALPSTRRERLQLPRKDSRVSDTYRGNRQVRALLELGYTGLPSSSQFAATFLLGWTRGGSPGIFG